MIFCQWLAPAYGVILDYSKQTHAIGRLVDLNNVSAWHVPIMMKLLAMCLQSLLVYELLPTDIKTLLTTINHECWFCLKKIVNNLCDTSEGIRNVNVFEFCWFFFWVWLIHIRLFKLFSFFDTWFTDKHGIYCTVKYLSHKQAVNQW